MIKLLLFILSLNAVNIFGISEQQNNVERKLPSEMSNAKNDSKIISTSDNTPADSNGNHEPKHKPPIVHQNVAIHKSHPEQNTNNGHNKTEYTEKIPPSHYGPNSKEQESSFLTTLSMVLISISLLFMVFVAFKTYRRKSRNARIKKYGIRLARGNIEMTPLPLDNDDDDETIFDLKNLPT